MDTTSAVPGAATGTDGGEARPRVVVGVDGSPGSRAALVHALVHAAGRGADLDVVASYAVELYYLGGAPLEVPDIGGIRDDTHDRVAELIGEVRADPAVAAVPGVGEVTVALEVSEGPAVQALLDRAEGADLLVVGSRGRGAVRSALLGSVALHCVTHASCPVLVVHAPPAGEPPEARIVVGLDGSAAARAALTAALAEAGRTGAAVEVVAGFRTVEQWIDLTAVAVPPVEELREEVRRDAERTVAEVLAERPADAGPEPTVRTEIRQGPPAELLVEAARGAQLLVVGSRGQGTWRGLLLGSVALHCAMHAPCPVLVVRTGPDRSAAGTRAPAGS